MVENKKEGARYITLKEASKISGYTPDYLGQLIRKGKLQGKQIYLNVAWVTTEEALGEYLEKNKTVGAKPNAGSGLKNRVRRWLIAHSSGESVIRIARRIIYTILVLLVALSIFLLYAIIANALNGGWKPL
jgi:hypothetical protein